MPTKYDVFAKLIEKSPCRESELGFKSEVYVQLKNLVKIGWVKEQNKFYVPIKNNKTFYAFKTIKYCLKNNLDYNLFFSKNMPLILTDLIKNLPNLRPRKLKNNKDILNILSYLENNQFILVHKKKPYIGIMLRHQLFDYILGVFDIKIKVPKPNIDFKDVKLKVKKIKGKPVNPFDEEIFSFLAGSAQLEGATISIGETRDLLVKDIYPEKPQKDIQMVKNLNEALIYVLENIDEEITEKQIKKINYLIMFSMHRHAGKYKITQNKIQGNPDFKTVIPSKVPEHMNSFCSEIKKINSANCLDKLGWIHNEFQRIHPFADGNSRTTRMILNWIMMQNGFPLIILKMGSFDEYMNLTKLSKKRDDDELTQFFWNILVHEEINK
ncbi:Fic family protein [Candidatus Woesearchaeota archaeon]|nr:Fic family protein [Candidatus Woesearchaeota archaeon]